VQSLHDVAELQAALGSDGVVQTPPSQPRPVQQSPAARQVWPAVRHWQRFVVRLQVMFPQQSASLAQVPAASKQHWRGPAPTSRQARP
jgi:hypothetical protein